MHATRWTKIKKAATTVALFTALVLSAYKPKSDMLPAIGVRTAGAQQANIPNKRLQNLIWKLRAAFFGDEDNIMKAILRIGKPAVPVLINLVKKKNETSVITI